MQEENVCLRRNTLLGQVGPNTQRTWGQDMRRWFLTLAVAAMVVGGAASAGAAPVSQSQSGSSSEQTCLSWYDTVGEEQGYVSLCGSVYDYGYGQSRSVSASRSVRTCDENGQACTDAYSESYNGPADATEFSMDVVAGTATFDIVLAGENDECTVDASARATEAYTYSDPYPRLSAYGSPTSPWASVQTGTTTVGASAYTNPDYPSASLWQNERANVSRQASGSGTVCGWVETQSAGSGSMWSNKNTNSTYSVTPLAIP